MQPQFTLSRDLQAGKAAEHLVCADLILQGYNAFLTDQGGPYDIVIDAQAGLKRVQVKSSRVAVPVPYKKAARGYCFNMRRGKGTRRIPCADEFDVVAFVALDLRVVAYIPVRQLLALDGVHVLQVVWMRAARQSASDLGFRWPRGVSFMMRCMEDYGTLALQAQEAS